MTDPLKPPVEGAFTHFDDHNAIVTVSNDHDDRLNDLEADVDELLATVARLWQAFTVTLAAVALLLVGIIAGILA